VGKYAAQAATALGLIARKGGPVVIQRKVLGAYNPVTQAASESMTSHTFQAVVMPPGRGAEYRAGSLAGKNAIELTLAQQGQSIQPGPGDVVTWNGQPWTIFWSTTYDPAGDGAIFTTAYAER
jgi:hypothetical protein